MSKPPRRISASYLENVSLHYLERFSSSADNLRRLLLRRVARAAQHHGDDPTVGAELVEALIRRYQETGLLDDGQYAGARSRSLHRRGASARKIRQTLVSKGVDADAIDTALSDLAEDHDGETDLAAARNFARRRRLGPWRLPEARAAMRDKDMAALGRAGFSWDVARTVLDEEL